MASLAEHHSDVQGVLFPVVEAHLLLANIVKHPDITHAEVAGSIRRHSELPFSSTINGSCSNVCPVHIDIHEQIYQWREVMDAEGVFSTTKKAAMKVAGQVLSNPRAYRVATEAGEAALKVLPRFAIYNRLNAWGRRRELPSPVAETFHQWYARNRPGDRAP